MLDSPCLHQISARLPVALPLCISAKINFPKAWMKEIGIFLVILLYGSVLCPVSAANDLRKQRNRERVYFGRPKKQQFLSFLHFCK